MHRYRDRYKGVRGLLDPTRSPKEVKQDELEQFYQNTIVRGKPPVEHLGDNYEHLSDILPATTLSTPEVKTKVSKGKIINDHIARKPVSDFGIGKDSQNKDFWNAYNSPNSKDMLNYVNKYKDPYQAMAKDEADNINAIKKMAWEESQEKKPKPKLVTAQDVMGVYQKKPPVKKLHQKLEAQNKPKQEKWHYTSRFDEIAKADNITDQVTKNLNKQDQETEVQKLAEDRKRESVGTGSNKGGKNG